MSDYYNIIDSAEKRAREEGRLAGIMQGREEGREEGLTQGREQGREEGLMLGREQGREEEKMDNAVKLKRLGVSVEVISQATGLAVDVIDAQ